MRNRSVVALVVAVIFGRNAAFIFDKTRSAQRCRLPSSNLIPYPLISANSLHAHRFNGGYDPASPLTWSPQQAAEFTIFHQGEPKYIGLQLRMAIQHWTGTELAEFLTRLYLGQIVEEKQQPVRSSSSPWTFGEESRHVEVKKKLVYEPQNVRAPQWKGLETREGILALKDLLKEALSTDTLRSREIARFAESFLLKEYKWPSRRIKETNGTPANKQQMMKNNTVPAIVFENDSFYTCGHAKTLARILWWIRKEKSSSFEWDDFVDMLTLPEHESKETAPLQLVEFYQTLVSHTPLSTMEKTQMVGRMALGGWSASEIPRFVTKILPDDAKSGNATFTEDDSFTDMPSAADVASQQDNKNEKKDKKEIDDQSILDATEEQVLLVSTLKRATLSVRSEYDQLVQSYWKQVEIPNSKKSPAKDTGRRSRTIKDAKVS
jgi:hypothetical protein